ncbi:MAG: Flp pilus assembly complex ATPase component TadA [Thermoproteales archaeon]|nr:Flp pilus assembly complex ATPase component TadA [Thermoproteales archaeon]RLE66190.1 MAG: ATPase [Thermoprotei archaeon]
MAVIELRETYLPDSSTITRGLLRTKIEEGELQGRIVIHQLLVKMFEKLFREFNNPMGFVGLKELTIIRQLISSQERDDLSLEYTKELPQGYRFIEPRSLSEVDDIIRELASEWNATLVTCDEVQEMAAKAMGVRVLLLKEKKRELLFEKFFEETTMSVHLKEGVVPYAKVGTPGRWELRSIGDTPLSREQLEQIEREILEVARQEKVGFIEIERPGSTIVQLKHYRIIIARPPFSDGLEITIVRPLIKLSLEDYNLPRKLVERLERQAEGILIAGAPGMGKTTFAQALAEYYNRKGKIVKTVESPRDMQLPEEVTQYSKNYSTSEEIHDVLLLSRPDYTVFDEMRDTRDFEIYSDLRLAGVGMIGVVHATTPIDAIQRFIGRVELGMIPSIIDTVIFIHKGRVEKVYELETVVKIPHGLREAELARPVVLIKDFLTSQPEYEIYVFGERTFVVPVKRTPSAREIRARTLIDRTMSKYIPQGEYEIQAGRNGEIMVLIEPEYLNSLSTKIFKRLKRIAKKLGMDVEIKPRS